MITRGNDRQDIFHSDEDHAKFISLLTIQKQKTPFFLYTAWKGRPTRTIPSDSSGSDGKDTQITYGGCGCAGGQITTVKGPQTDAIDVSGTAQTGKRRVEIGYADILGRTFKTEVHDLDDPSGTPYSTVKTTFNALDKPTLVRQYAGSDSSSTYQDITMSYDGHGRVYQSHKPEQRDSAGTTLKYTTNTYNADDSVATQTDGRGAVTTYSYGHIDEGTGSEYRKMLTKVAYTVPGGSGITDPSDVTFTYDSVGDRTAMTDGLGSVAYAYDPLSQMTSETRSFNDTLTDAPTTGNAFQLQYTYTLSGALKSYTDPYGQEIDYAHDKTGRLSAVTGSTFASVTSYANNPSYRAWGAIKHLEYGNGAEINLTHNNKLEPSTFELKKATTSIMKKDYDYYQTGELKKVTDEANSWFDNLFKYDFNTRTTAARSTTEASGTTETNLAHLPFHQDFSYDAFSHMSNMSGTRWTDYESLPTTYLNNIKYQAVMSTYYPHDDDGRDTTAYQYDGGGQNIFVQGVNDDETYRYFDGNQAEGKRGYRYYDNSTDTWSAMKYAYFITSRPLGGAVITEADATGKKTQTYVIDGDSVIARQQQVVVSSTTYTSVVWEHRDPSDTEVDFTDASGAGTSANDTTPSHYDGLGRMTGSGFFLGPPPPADKSLSIFANVPPELGTGQCTVTVDGIEDSCDHVSSEATVQCPNNYCGPIPRKRDINGDGKIDSYWDIFYSFNDGHSGYGPATGGSYAGDGHFVLANQPDQPPTARSRVRGDIPPHIAGGPNAESDWEADDQMEGGMKADTFVTPTTQSGLKSAVQVFFEKFGKAFRDCAWSIFSKDREGNTSNIATVMEKPSSKTFPYDKVVIVSGMGVEGYVDKDGTIGLRESYQSVDLYGGGTVSALDQFNRTLGHEYANYLSWKYTGVATTFGAKDGVRGDASAGNGLRSANIDYDTGARMEECVWHNVAY